MLPLMKNKSGRCHKMRLLLPTTTTTTRLFLARVRSHTREDTLCSFRNIPSPLTHFLYDYDSCAVFQLTEDKNTAAVSFLYGIAPNHQPRNNNNLYHPQPDKYLTQLRDLLATSDHSCPDYYYHYHYHDNNNNESMIQPSSTTLQAFQEWYSSSTTSQDPTPKAVRPAIPKVSTTASTFFQTLEKENKQVTSTKTSKSKKQPAKQETNTLAVGTVDDFVGDVEEDDDDDSVPPPHSKKRPSQPQEDDLCGRPPPKKPSPNEKNKPKTVKTQHGAMDDFASQKHTTIVKEDTTSKSRRRRKVLQHRTTADENGYIHTETVEVWEDVPSDEEQEKPTRSVVVAAPQKKQPPKAKKQQNLMGFFQKK